MNSETLDLVKQSDSTIIILIVVLVAAIIALIPVINIITKAKGVQQLREINQQDKLIAVIQGNTEVNASLKMLLEDDRKTCDDCRKQQYDMFAQIQDNQDLANMKLVEIHTMIKKEEQNV